MLRFLALVLLVAAAPASAQSALYADAAQRLVDAALADSAAYDRIAELGDTFGHRLSGSASLERSIDWILDAMRADGLESVRGQPVRVPHWVRGDESVTLLTPNGEVDLPMLGLGGSVATPAGGVEAEVLVVTSFDDLEARADEAQGRIVVYDVPFTSYGRTVAYRVGGASAAARHGAVASLVRSVGPVSLQTPHTGTMRYADDAPRIPTAAVTIEGAERLARIQARGERPRLRLVMTAQTLPDAMSRNVIAELRGRERPDEVVVLGGHIDSWDVGQGVTDDAGGCIAAWEALRLMKALGLRPRRTVQVVLWTNEENGLRGAEVYRDSLDSVEHIQLAVESDSGVFAPVGFGLTGAPGALETLRSAVGPLLAPVLEPGEEPSGLTEGGGGADIGPLMRDGVPGAGLRVDGERYFWLHHTAADTIDKLDPTEVQRNVAALAVLAYVAAEMPERLPHGAAGE